MLPLWDIGPTVKFPFWVIFIITLNIFVFYLELTVPDLDLFITQYALIPSTVNFMQLGTLTPFVTSLFLHGGFLHIISNMWFFWIFGDNVEYKLGDLFFPVFYLAAGIAGNFLQYMLMPHSPIPALGASGAIAGTLGAYYAFFPKNRVKTLVFFLIADLPASLVLFYWLILQLFNSAEAVSPAAAASSSGGTAYFAHIGGFAAGWLVGKLIVLANVEKLKN